MVALDVSAAGGTDLDEGEDPLIGRILLQEALNRKKPFHNPLGVVEAVDANAHRGGFDAEGLQQRCSFFVSGLVRGLGVRIGEGDTDGERADGSVVIEALDGEVLPTDAGLDDAIDRLQEVGAMRLNVESNEVSAQQSVDEFTLPGANTECFGIRPRNVPEDGDASVGAGLLDHSAATGRSGSPAPRRLGG